MISCWGALVARRRPTLNLPYDNGFDSFLLSASALLTALEQL